MVPFHQMFRFYVKMLCDGSNEISARLNIKGKAADSDVFFVNKFFIQAIFSHVHSHGTSCR